MKKMFYKLIAWFKGLFKKSSSEVIEKEKTKEEELFEKLKDSGFFKKDDTPSIDQLNHDLAESARKGNEYKDLMVGIKEPVEMSAELSGQLKGERAKDRTTLIRQQIVAKEEAEKRQVKPRTPSTNIGTGVPKEILKKMTGKDSTDSEK